MKSNLNDSSRCGGSRTLSVAVFVLGVFLAASRGYAQSVPTDLIDMNLVDLMELQVERRGPQLDENLSWHDPSRLSLAYRYTRITFKGYRDGTDNIPNAALIGPPNGVTFPVLQDKIVQQAHSFEIAYAFTRRISARLIVPYIRQATDHNSIAGGPTFADFTIRSDGIGDTSLTGSFRAFDSDHHSVVVNVGLSFPTGSIRKKGDTPLPGTRNQLPFTMQLGSGTWDIILSAGYQGRTDSLESTHLALLGSVGWGVQVLGKIRTGENDRNYRLGNRLIVSAWMSARPFQFVEPFLKLNTEIWGTIHGNDESSPGPIFPTPVSDPGHFGGEKLVLTGGVTLRLPDLPEGRFYAQLSKQSVTIEYGQPVYESLNGPQPRERRRLSVNWATSF